MSDYKQLTEFVRLFKKSLNKTTFVSLKLANCRDVESELKQVRGKLVELKKGVHLSLIYRYKTKDVTKNYTFDEATDIVFDLMKTSFYQGTCATAQYDYFLTMYKVAKSKLRHKASQAKDVVVHQHDHIKNRIIPYEGNRYLQKLGITSQDGQIKSKMHDKYKQINKYVEIIDDILKKTVLPENPVIVDMGSGKGYLTFALYDYYQRLRKENVEIHGVEMRSELVDLCNEIAKDSEFENLKFQEGTIQQSNFERIDFLIALHACDTATDDAILKGIKGGSQLIVCAPCCHKQVRKHMYTTGIFEEITKHGSMQERQAELLTDTIRAMMLEAYGYKTRIFEFISTSHTPKNLMIVASLDERRTEAEPEKLKQVELLMKEFGIAHQFLHRNLTSGTYRS